MTDKAKAIVDGMRKKLGDEAAHLMRDGEAVVQEVIPTGIDVLDHYAMGIGGLPMGRIIELYSEEGSGKTTLGHTFLAAAQRVGGVAALAETEGAFDQMRAAVLGVNIENLIMLEPDWIEQVVIHLETALEQIADHKAWPAVIVWDSVAQTPTKAEFEDGMAAGGGKVAERARCLSQAMRILVPRVKRARACLVFINQIRENIGVVFGDKTVTPGGHAIKFAASIRMQILGGKAVKDDSGEHIAKDVTIFITKNRLAAPFRKARVRLDYAGGWDNDWSTVNHAKDKGIVPKGARFNAKTLEASYAGLGWNLSGPETTAATTLIDS